MEINFSVRSDFISNVKEFKESRWAVPSVAGYWEVLKGIFLGITARACG